MKTTLFALILAMVLAFSGCSASQPDKTAPAEPAPAPVEKPAPTPEPAPIVTAPAEEEAPAEESTLELPHSMGVTQFTFDDGSALDVEVEMTDGFLMKDTDENYCPGGGIISGENYIGQFRLIARRDVESLSTLDCGDQNDTTFIFHGPIAFEPYDYNSDGSLEFTLGSWGSSSMTLFTLYSVTPDGTLSVIQKEIVDLGMAVDTRKFEPTENGFLTQSYSNATATTSGTQWTWNGEVFVEG